jgi:enamine deaminase RidA (YjgF/YER057c/UK114 family)
MRRLISSGSEWEDKVGYSRAVVDGDMVHVSGTTGYDYASGRIPDDAAAQTRQTLANIEVALGQAGCSLRDVVRARYYFTDRDDWPAIYPVLGEVFGAVRPAATAVVCGLIDPAMKIEIEVTARKGSG